MKKMDDAIEKSMLEFLKDDLTTVKKENKNTGGLLAQDEKVGVERFIESLQLVSWSNMEMAQKKAKPSLSCVIGENQVPIIQKNPMQKLQSVGEGAMKEKLSTLNSGNEGSGNLPLGQEMDKEEVKYNTSALMDGQP